MKLRNLIPRWLNKRINYARSVTTNPSRSFKTLVKEIKTIDGLIDEAFNSAEDKKYGGAIKYLDYAWNELYYLDESDKRHSPIISAVNGELMRRELEFYSTFGKIKEIFPRVKEEKWRER